MPRSGCDISRTQMENLLVSHDELLSAPQPHFFNTSPSGVPLGIPLGIPSGIPPGVLEMPPEIQEIISDEQKLIESWNILARDNYEFYVEYVHNGIYQHGRHTRLICKELQQVEANAGLNTLNKPPRLIITTPPRHSKSMSVTETFPSYFIGKKPHRRVIQTSYGDSLARKFGRANKQKIEEHGADIFDIKVSRDTSAVDNWGIQGYRGGMLSTGIGGAITGEGADLLLIDDPIKNREEANSKTYRDKVWNEWQNTLRTRLHPGAAVVIIITRWHEDDLVGRLLNPEYGEVEDWKIINLPAIAEENDLLGREVGEPLWPEHGFDLAWAIATEKAVGSATWASLYQQRPAAAEGSMIKRDWWKYYNIPYQPGDDYVCTIGSDGILVKYFVDEVIQSWDMTFKSSEGTDMVVGQTWVRSDAYKFLVDQIRKRMDFPQTLAAVKAFANKWSDARTKLVEDKANGPAIISMLQSTISGMIPVDPKDSKVARVSAVSPDIESGNVFIPTMEVAAWSDAYVDELASFPKGTFDDQVDCTSQALARLTKSSFKRKRPDKEQGRMSASQRRIHEHINMMVKKSKNGGKKQNNYIAR